MAVPFGVWFVRCFSEGPTQDLPQGIEESVVLVGSFLS